MITKLHSQTLRIPNRCSSLMLFRWDHELHIKYNENWKLIKGFKRNKWHRTSNSEPFEYLVSGFIIFHCNSDNSVNNAISGESFFITNKHNQMITIHISGDSCMLNLSCFRLVWLKLNTQDLNLNLRLSFRCTQSELWSTLAKRRYTLKNQYMYWLSLL